MCGALVVGALSAQSGSGCVLPPDLNPTGADAGPSSPPVILSASPAESFAIPGPIVVSRENSPPMSLLALDNDVGDLLFVRFYIDYMRPPRNLPTPPVTDCQAPVGGTVERVIDCQTNSLCTPVGVDDTQNHILEAMISDRPFLLESDPQGAAQPDYRKVADFPLAGYSFTGWVMRCQAPQ